MYQYGPWDLNNERQMKHVATLLLACTLGELSKNEASIDDDPFLDESDEDDKGEGSGKGKGLPSVLEKLSM